MHVTVSSSVLFIRQKAYSLSRNVNRVQKVHPQNYERDIVIHVKVHLQL